MAPHSASPEVAAGATLTERNQSRRLVVVLVLVACFFFVELAGARAAKSDVLEADAFHLLMDVFALAISLVAMRLASSRPSERFTFGLRRAESLAALTNGILVIGVAIELVRDAVAHLVEPTAPRATVMLVVASLALVVNGFSAWLLHGAMHHGHAHGHGHAHEHASVETRANHAHGHDHAHDHDHAHGHDHAHADDHASEGGGHHLNLRGAWLHLLGDALGALAAFGAGLAIRFGASPIVDPIASLLVVAILLVGAFRLLRDAGYVLLEAAPKRVSVAKVKSAISAFSGVTSLHALHVWSLGTGHDAVTVHVSTARPGDAELGRRLAEALRTKFRLEYVTVQVDVDPA